MTQPLQPSPAIAAFEQRAFGLFIHFGLYSQAGQGEWYRHHHQIPAQRYATLMDSFTAADFDAEVIARTAAAAGMRYACLTTRHHDGFSLYDTRGLNSFDAVHSPAGRDLVAEFVTACRNHDLGVFLYHTTLDWWHPDFDGDWPAYQRYLRDSVDILLSHYGPVDGLWFDGNWARRDRDWEEDALYDLIRQRQPDCLIINNSSHGHHGEAGHPQCDVVTFEQGRPFARRQVERYRAGEMCETMNSHWGTGAHDLSHKSPADIITRLVSCRRYRANLLLNIGPEAQGAMPGLEAAVLAQVGRWIKICPPAVYQAVPTQLRCGGDDFVLQDGSTYYYFCHNVPIHGNRHLLQGRPGDGPQGIIGALPQVRRISWVDNDEELTFSQDGDICAFQATPFAYGSQLIVRIARLET